MEQQRLSKEAQSVNWLVSSFVRRVPGVAHAVVVSADGLLTAVSERLDRTRADQLAAVANGLISLTKGASRAFGGGAVNQVAVEMERGFLLMIGVGDGSAIAALASPSIDLGQVGFEMAVVAAQCGQALTPELRAELQAALPR